MEPELLERLSDLDEEGFYSLVRRGTFKGACAEVQGMGRIGRVVSPPDIPKRIRGKRVVIKQPLHRDTFFLLEKKEDGRTVIRGNSLLMDIILLSHMNRLRNPHLLECLGYSTCDDDYQALLERCGLDKPISPPGTRHNLFRMFEEPPPSPTTVNTLGTLLANLTAFGLDRAHVIDAFVVAFLHTTWLLWTKLRITLFDQHPDNIFVSWTSQKKLVYQLDDSVGLEVPLPGGIVFKLGDVSYAVMARERLLVYGCHNKDLALESYLLGGDEPFPSYWTAIDMLRAFHDVRGSVIGPLVEMVGIGSSFEPLGSLEGIPNQMELLRSPVFDRFRKSLAN